MGRNCVAREDVRSRAPRLRAAVLYRRAVRIIGACVRSPAPRARSPVHCARSPARASAPPIRPSQPRVQCWGATAAWTRPRMRPSRAAVPRRRNPAPRSRRPAGCRRNPAPRVRTRIPCTRLPARAVRAAVRPEPNAAAHRVGRRLAGGRGFISDGFRPLPREPRRAVNRMRRTAQMGRLPAGGCGLLPDASRRFPREPGRTVDRRTRRAAHLGRRARAVDGASVRARDLGRLRSQPQTRPGLHHVASNDPLMVSPSNVAV